MGRIDMDVKKQKKSKNHGNLLMMLCFMLIGAVCGIVMMEYIDYVFGDNLPVGESLFNLAVAFFGMYIAIFLQIIIHETGHLIAGLLTGYTFSSFRFGSLMWMKDNETIKFRKLSLAGTGGQCLMNPPDMVDGKMPFVFYNLGGSLMNFITIPICAVLFFLFSKVPYFSLFLLMMCIVGFGCALMNGIPMKLGMINNDGYNAKDLGKSPEALKSFWVQLKVTEQMSKGVRLKDMPSEWFYLPDEDGIKNSMTAVMAVFYANKLMDEQAFADAAALLDKLLAAESGIVGLHRNLLICDRLYCELINKKNSEVVDKLYSKEQKKFIKQMRKFPTVIRTEYTYALLYKNDADKAAQIKELFEKCAKTHPYASDIESERELLEIADEAMQNSVN